MLPYPTFPCHVKRLHVLYIFSYYLSDFIFFYDGTLLDLLCLMLRCLTLWRFLHHVVLLHLTPNHVILLDLVL